MRYAAAYLWLLGVICAHAQQGLFINGSSASLRVDTGAFISVEGDFLNNDCDPVLQVRFNGPLYLAGSLINNDSLKFKGSTNSSSHKSKLIFRNSNNFSAGYSAIIGGSVTPELWHVEVDKGSNGVTMQNNVRQWDTLHFKSGSVFLNGRNWELVDPVGAVTVLNHPWIHNERFNHSFRASDTNDSGVVIYKTSYTQSQDLNPANLGILLQGLLDPGSSVEFYRGFKRQLNVAKASIGSFYIIKSPHFALTSATVQLRYFKSDMSLYGPGYLANSELKIFASENKDSEWAGISAGQYTLVSGLTSVGYIRSSLSEITHPNTALDGKNLRLVIADPDCTNKPQGTLNSDTMYLCTGTSEVLDAGNLTPYANTSLKYEWEVNPPVYTRTITVSPDSVFRKYRVNLRDIRGCTNVDSVFMAPEAPYPEVVYLNYLSSCVGDSITIKDTVRIASGTYSNSWWFSDSTTIHTQENLFKRKFGQAGEYHLKLTSTSNHGCVTTVTAGNIAVYPLPTARFSSSHDCGTDEVTFTNNSVSNVAAHVIAACSWTLDENVSGTSTVTSPVYTYPVPGTYQVKLLVSTSFGCRDTVSDTIVIYPRNAAAFSSRNVCLGDSLKFSNTSACNTGSCSYTWFDGINAVSQQDFGTEFSAVGMYTVKLKVLAPVGCPDSLSKVVFVHPVPVPHFSLSTYSSCVNYQVYGINTSSIAGGTIQSFYWDFGDGNNAATINASNSYSLGGLYQVQLTATSDSGCVNIASQTFTSWPQPVADFSVSTVCEDEPSHFVSSSFGLGLSYSWMFDPAVTTTTTANTISYQYMKDGVYTTTLFVTDINGCKDTAIALVNVLNRPELHFGGQIATCGKYYLLDALNAGSTYSWWPNGEISQTITATTTGNYSVVVTGTNGCSTGEAVQVVLNDEVIPDLGVDTTVCGQLVLDAGYNGSTFLWSNLVTTQTLLASFSGTYAVSVIDQNQCQGSDTIAVTILDLPQVKAGNDTSICSGHGGLTVTADGNAFSYLWNDGQTGITATFTGSGVYVVVGTHSNGCTASDTMMLEIRPSPVVDLGPDRSGCGMVLLDAQNTGCEYTWNDGSKQQLLYKQESGLVFVTVTNTVNGCFSSDTVNVTVHPLVHVDLGPDTAVCSNVTFVLDAANPGSFYNWINGSHTQTILIENPGLYGVTVTNAGGCSGSDYINISFTKAPEVELGASFQYKCSNQELRLESPQAQGNRWFSDNGLYDESPSIFVTAAGKYWLEVFNEGCYGSDTVLVSLSTNTIQAMFLASTIDTVNKPVQFVNLSKPEPISQIWYFGDGTSSTEFSPVHTYYLPHDFNVTLEVTNGECSDRMTKALSVLFREKEIQPEEGEPALLLKELVLFPNPAAAEIAYRARLNRTAAVVVMVTDVTGRLLLEHNLGELRESEGNILLQHYAQGVYLFHFTASGLTGKITERLKFIKTE